MSRSLWSSAWSLLRGSRATAHPDTEPGTGGDTGMRQVSARVGARSLRTGSGWVAGFAVVGYPAAVSLAWLDPLLNHPGHLDVSVYIDPLDPTTAATRLRRRLAHLEAGRRHAESHGRLADPLVDAAAEDAEDLAAQLARGEGKLYRFGLYLAVHAPDPDTLADEVAAVRALAASLLLDARPASYQQLAGWVSCLPVGLDGLRMHRTMDTAAVSAAMPFTSPDLPSPDPADPGALPGVLYGHNVSSSGLVFWDRWAVDNANAVVFGQSGAGKSYLLKACDVLRQAYRGVEVVVIDPEHEYTRLTHALGGHLVALGAPDTHLNPFELPIHEREGTGRWFAPADAPHRRALFLITFLTVLIGTEPEPDERVVLDEAIHATYARAGITDDPDSWAQPAPVLADLADVLAEMADPIGPRWAARIRPHTRAGLFAGPSTATPAGHLVSFSLRELPEQTRPVATLIVLDLIWRRLNTAHQRPTLVVIDEAWQLMQLPAGAEFVARTAKAIRKRNGALTLSTQDTADLLGSQLGHIVVANAATKILLHQDHTSIDDVTRVFGLSDGERELLLRARPGEGLLISGEHRVAFRGIASPTEHELCKADRTFLTDLDEHQTGLVELPSPGPRPPASDAR